MRALIKNKQSFYYALYKGEEDIFDDDNNRTGETRVTYYAWKPYMANISPATGYSQVEQFGSNEQYDKVIVIDDPNCDIDEHTILCIDILPDLTYKTEPVFDYVVKKKARSLNSVSYAVSKVEVGAVAISVIPDTPNEVQTDD